MSDHQWKRIKHTGTILSECGYLSKDTMTWQISGGKQRLFDKWVIGCPFGKKIGPCLISYTKINSR